MERLVIVVEVVAVMTTTEEVVVVVVGDEAEEDPSILVIHAMSVVRLDIMPGIVVVAVEEAVGDVDHLHLIEDVAHLHGADQDQGVGLVPGDMGQRPVELVLNMVPDHVPGPVLAPLNHEETVHAPLHHVENVHALLQQEKIGHVVLHLEKIVLVVHHPDKIALALHHHEGSVPDHLHQEGKCLDLQHPIKMIFQIQGIYDLLKCNRCH